MFRHRRLVASVASAIAALIAAGVLYQSLVPGLSVATKEPPRIETVVAQWLLHRSVPAEAKARTNPQGADPADLAAGQDLFQKKCQACHAYDGAGRTEIGSGLYPRPPALRAMDIQALSDGEIFYHIRNGIRNTGMPAWPLPDRETWQLVAYIRHLPVTAAMAAPASAAPAPTAGAAFVGSAACTSCHQEVYARWSKTKMANVVRDPKEHPDAIIADFSKPDPLVDFSRDDIAFVYGSLWKQRYFKKVGDDYFPFPAQWDVSRKIWRKYLVADGTDWWTAHYPADNFQRPTGPLCDGCHSVNYNIETKTVTEWNVGCEKCHGAGEAHVKQPIRSTIINPARLDYVQANDTCIQCHSQGQPVKNPIAGKYYDWPVGFNMGLKLSDYWKLEEHKLGALTFTHFPDGTAHKNRMQGNDYVNSLMYARGVTCFSCHDVHGTDNVASLRKSPTETCLSCHGPNTQNGPHTATLEEHTHHKAGSTGSACTACHMPKIAQTIADTNVSSHTFHFVTPGDTDALKIPNACNVCHTDQTTAWTAAALKTWTDRSPWRMSR